MNDFRRVILVLLFAASGILLWDQWQVHNGGQATFFALGRVTTSTSTSAPATGNAQVNKTPVAASGTTPAGSVLNGGSTALSVPIEVTTDVLKLEFDSVGATLVRAELTQYRDTSDKKKNMVLFDRSKDRLYEAQTGISVQGSGVGAIVRPNHFTPMQLVSQETALKDGQNTLTVQFEGIAGDAKLIKTFTFKRGAYDIAVQQQVVNLSTSSIEPTLYFELVRDGNKPSTMAYASVGPSVHAGPVVYTDAKKYQKFEFSDIEKNKADFAREGNAGYVAITQHYFVTAWLLADGIKRDNTVRITDKNTYAVGMMTQMPAIAAGQSGALNATLYVGPQDENKLEHLYPGLELVKDYGIFTVLAKPLYWLLDKLHGLFGNWGWSIVGLVVLLKLVFYWFNAKAYASMAKMKAMGPRLTQLREQFKDNPEKLRTEMMRIYREEKINPLGGCLPIVVQIPVFFALYSVLLSSVEMRGAPWIWWIKDLSEMDPYYILPVLMTASTLLQTWLNPTPPDPTQAKLMWIMPLVFSVMFFFFPAGLVLYWLVNNLLSIAQQWLINKRLGVLAK